MNTAIRGKSGAQPIWILWAEDSLLLGDKLLTDCAAGRRAGMRVIIVPPIKDKTTLFFRAKRWIERPYVRKYQNNPPSGGLH
ncbi:MAG: hypothetical protein IKZ41_06250 [Clostridia bacterium]|nr:hypothetical protein [Clostridia bacterium]